MTAINTLIPYYLPGSLQFAPLGSICAGISESIDSPARQTNVSNRGRNDSTRIVILWHDLASRNPELREISSGFWMTHSLDHLAAAQNSSSTSEISNSRGIWPPDDLDDDFENAVRRWRNQDAEYRQ